MTGRQFDDSGEPAAGPAGRDVGRAPLGGPPELLQWLAPDATSPPAHVHPDATETFAVLSGTLTVVLDGEARELSSGESVAVDAGVAHTFRNDTGGVVAFRAELPSLLTARSLYSIWALDEGAAGADGEPGPLHAMMMAADLNATAAPVAVQRVLGATLGRLARAMGYDGVDQRYVRDEFWEERVEQPDL